MPKKSDSAGKIWKFPKISRSTIKLPVVLIVLFALVGTLLLVSGFAAPKARKTTVTGATSTAVNLHISPDSTRVSKGQQFTVEVRMNAQTQPINAAQAVLSYPTDKLEFIGIDSSESAFDFRLTETGGEGQVEIVQGTAQQKTGNQLLATVTFRALAPKGKASITFKDTSALAHATENNDVLQQTFGSSITLAR